MPRDFVPCAYTDQQMYDWSSECLMRRCQVIEYFAGTDIATRDPLLIMSLDSHAYFLDTDKDDDRACAHLFGIFYAAMAALE